MSQKDDGYLIYGSILGASFYSHHEDSFNGFYEAIWSLRDLMEDDIYAWRMTRA